MKPPIRGLDRLQKISMTLMAVLALVTFFGTNIQAVLWQSSDWLVSTVLPATVVDLTNEEREELAAKPLVRNATLDEAARMKAEHMAKNEYFAHYAPDGTSPWHWFDESGYVYAHAGENLAIHFTDSSEVVEAWMDSPTHRANIVDQKYTEIGVGTAKGEFDGYDTVYVVQLFGTPAVSPLTTVTETAPTAPVVESVVTEVVEREPTPEPVSPVPVSTPEPEPVIEEAPVVAIETPEPVVEIEVVSDPVPEPRPFEPLPEPEEAVAPAPSDVVIVETTLISTSSGLAVAQFTTPNDGHAGATVASIATQPHVLLQIVYMLLAAVVVLLLSTSVVVEARQLHYRQVAYGLLLLFGMGGLWFMHTLLTAGAVIV